MHQIVIQSAMLILDISRTTTRSGTCHLHPLTPIKRFWLTARLGWPFASADRPGKTQRYRKGFRSGQGEAPAVVFPGTLLELWRVLNACVDADKIILMQAANTGLTEGSTPNGNDYDREIVIISTLRPTNCICWTKASRCWPARHHPLFAGKRSNRWDANRTR